MPKEFILNIIINSITMNKTFQTRHSTNLIFARIDCSKIHSNPDSIKIGCPHIHIQTEQYADKWAFELPKEFFTNTNDYFYILLDFVKMCNIQEYNRLIEMGLFV